MDPEPEGSDELDLPDYQSNVFSDVPSMAAYVIQISQQINAQRREPTAQLGDFVISTHERFTDRGGRRSTGDQLAEVLAMRSISSGGDMDSFFENGNATWRRLPVPCQKFAFRVMRPFRVSMERRRGNRTTGGAVSFDDMTKMLREYAVLGFFLGVTTPEIVEINRLLQDDDQLDTLRQFYGGSISLTFYKKNWVQNRGEFVVEEARKGNAFWVIDRNSPDSYTHEYRGFLSPPKAWLDERIQRYIDGHPQRDRILELCSKTFTSPHTRDGARGKGLLRNYGYNELWHQNFNALLAAGTFDEATLPEPYRTNRKNWRDGWWLRLHLWKAFEEAFREYALDFRNSVEAFKEYRNRGGGYFDTFVQSPPTFQYLAWKLTETYIQFRKEEDPTFEGQTLEERNEALEKVLNMLSWVEKLPRCARNGDINWSWYARPEHDSDRGGHCQGCQHYDQWVTEEQYQAKPDKYPGWVRQEAQTWYATRQELQLLRKIIYTHNSGSGNHDISNYGLLTESTIATARNSYMGGGNEATPPRSWWVPGQTLTTGLLVDRYWWLELVAKEADQGVRIPYNSFWLRSFQLKVDIQNSRVKFERFLGLNTTGAGISHDQLHKELGGIFDQVDDIVFPHWEEKELGDRPDGVKQWGNDKWVDFDLQFNHVNPRVTVYRDPAFFIDWKWFLTRSNFDPAVAEIWIENFETTFGRDYPFLMTWPDQTKTIAQGFRDPMFRQYLVSNWVRHRQLAKDYFDNQDTHEFELSLRDRLNQAKGEGQADLRVIVSKEMAGLPTTMPKFDANGVVTGLQLSSYGHLKARLLEEADNRLWQSIALKAEGGSGARGFTFGEAAKLYDSGFGRGYGTIRSQLRRALRIFDLALKCRYYDTWKGIVESHHVDLENEPDEIRKAIASALRTRALNYEYALKVVEDLKIMNILPGDFAIPSEVAHESIEMEKKWRRELIKLLTDGSGETGARIVEALQKEVIVAMPEDPEGMRAFEASKVEPTLLVVF